MDRSVEPGAEPIRGSGWLSFAAVMLLLGGTFNVIDGVTALVNGSAFSHNSLYADITTWGWIMIALGSVEIVIAFGVLARSTIAATIGIMIAMLNAIAQLFFIPSYPIWSLLIIAIDVIVIYGLVVYGGTPKRYHRRV